MTADFWSPDPDPQPTAEEERIEATRRGAALCRAMLQAAREAQEEAAA